MKKEVTLYILEKDNYSLNSLTGFSVTSGEFIAAYASEIEAETHRQLILRGMLEKPDYDLFSVSIKKIQFPMTVAQKMLIIAEEQT